MLSEGRAPELVAVDETLGTLVEVKERKSRVVSEYLTWSN